MDCFLVNVVSMLIRPYIHILLKPFFIRKQGREPLNYMKHFSLLFIGIFSVLASSFLGLIITSQNQIGSLKQSTESLELNDEGTLVMVDGDPLFPQNLRISKTRTFRIYKARLCKLSLSANSKGFDQ